MKSSFIAPLPNDLQGKFKRLASIVVQFGEVAAFNDAVIFYSKLLGTDAETTDTGARFAIGKPGLLSKKDIELLFLKPNTTEQKNNSTVIYWEVGKDLQAINDEIITATGYRQIIFPPNEPRLRPAPEQRSLIEDKIGNQFGLVMNPNFPRFVTPPFVPIPTFIAQNLKSLTILLAVLGMGLIIPSLRRKRFH